MKKTAFAFILLFLFSFNVVSAMPIEDELAKRKLANHLVLVLVTDPTLKNSPDLMARLEKNMEESFPKEKYNMLIYTPDLKESQAGLAALADGIAKDNTQQPSINQFLLNNKSVSFYSDKYSAALTTVVYISTYSKNAAGSYKDNNLVLRADTRTLAAGQPGYNYVNFIDSGVPLKARPALKKLLKTFENTTVPYL